ncbi:hypothetical protein D3C72_1229660 [compost metagenome]
MDQVRADDRRLHALQHHLPQRLAHDNLQMNGLSVILRLPGRYLDGVLLEVNGRFRPHHDILPPLKTQQPQPDGAFQPDRRPHIIQNRVQPLNGMALALLLGLFFDQGQFGGVAFAQALGNREREHLDQQPTVFRVGVVLETIQILRDSQHIQLPHHQIAQVLAVPGQLEFDFLQRARGVGLGGQPFLFEALQAAAELWHGITGDHGEQ